MKTLNSVHSRGMNAKIAGVGVLAIAAILLLSFAPFFSFAAGTTVTVQTSAASYPTVKAGTQIPITGTVSPAPGATGYSITLEVTNTAGLNYVVSTAVDATSGAFSYTLVTGNTSGLWVAGVYTVTGVYSSSINSPSVTGSTTFQYGPAATTSTSPTTTTSSNTGGSTTTVVTTIYTTVDSITTVNQGGTTVTQVTTVNQGGTTVTSLITQMTTVSGSGSTTALAIGAVGLVIAIIAGALAAMALRKH